MASLTASAMVLGLAAVSAGAAQASSPAGASDNKNNGRSEFRDNDPRGPRTTYEDRFRRNPRPERNPEMTEQCGINLAIVVDRSRSINWQPGGIANVKSALTGLVDEMVGTGTVVSLISFATDARTEADNIRINTQADANRLDGPINALVADGSTNWADALSHVRGLSQEPDLVLFVTDGRPNTISLPNGTTQVPSDFRDRPIDFSQIALNAAVLQANAIREDDTRIFALAVGNAATAGDFGDAAIRTISGNREWEPGDTIRDTDYVRLTNARALNEQLLTLAADICTSLDKTNSPRGDVSNGQTIKYKVKLRNTGPVSVTDGLVDDLPVGVTYVRGSASERGPARVAEPRVTRLPGGAQRLTFRDFTLDRGESQVFRYKVRVNRDADRGDVLENKAMWNLLEDSTTNTVKGCGCKDDKGYSKAKYGETSKYSKSKDSKYSKSKDSKKSSKAKARYAAKGKR